ncbi:MAG TPA: hypothetical protein VHZ03_46915 [Trebonia sp.]|jgi:hypothetical protein|nr:hypothetical protein [Trebonia sp.]
MTERAVDIKAAGVGDAGTAQREARILARLAEDARVKGRTPDDALAAIADMVRYTFEYPADRYTECVRADIERLWREGHVELAVRNCWTCPTWKGISTSWQEPAAGQLFEVQFHTPQSLAAREATYPAYQRLRDPATPDAERGAIMASLREVYAGEPACQAPAAEKARAARLVADQLQSERTRSMRFQALSDDSPDRVTHYAIVDQYSSQDAPAGVLRRVEYAGSPGTGEQDGRPQRDEAFGRDLRWRHTYLLYSWERGNLDNSLHEISQDRAMRITDWIRREVTRNC